MDQWQSYSVEAELQSQQGMEVFPGCGCSENAGGRGLSLPGKGPAQSHLCSVVGTTNYHTI